jgi:hypothetical protein
MIAWLFLAIGVAASAGEVPLKLARLDLVDGRTLTNVVIKSYDAATGRLLLVADGTAMLIPVSLVPPPFGERIKTSAPAAGATTSVVTMLPAGPAPAVTSPQSAPAAAGSPAAAEADRLLLASHRKVAAERARRYYEFESWSGSSAISVTKLDIQTEPPGPIDGWPGRCRTRGTAYLEFFDSKGRSFSRSSGRFEVITELKPDGSVTAVDFTPK